MADDLFAVARHAFNAVDPMGFIRLGFPEEEYDPEVRDLCARVEAGEVLSPELIDAVLIRWFRRLEPVNGAPIHELMQAELET